MIILICHASQMPADPSWPEHFLGKNQTERILITSFMLRFQDSFGLHTERVMGLEPTTATLATWRSTTELHPQTSPTWNNQDGNNNILYKHF